MGHKTVYNCRSLKPKPCNTLCAKYRRYKPDLAHDALQAHPHTHNTVTDACTLRCIHAWRTATAPGSKAVKEETEERGYRDVEYSRSCTVQ